MGKSLLLRGNGYLRLCIRDLLPHKLAHKLKPEGAIMGIQEGLSEENNEGPDESDCTGDPYECQCARCRAWLIDVEADRQYDERKEAA
jgi:hypothetical protein